MTDAPNAEPDPMQELADHLVAIDKLLQTPEVSAVVGGGIQRELSYATSALRQRFPDRFPQS